MSAEPHEPSEDQVRVVERAHARLASSWTTTTPQRFVRWQHYEDEALGESPLGSTVGFNVKVGPLTVHIGTSWATFDSVSASFREYAGDRPGPPFVLVVDAPTRRALADHGFRSHERTWRLARGVDAAVDTIVDTVQKLAALPLRVLVPADLPPSTEWPPPVVFAMFWADSVTVVGDAAGSPGKQLVIVETDGERSNTIQSLRSVELARWWRAANGLEDVRS